MRRGIAAVAVLPRATSAALSAAPGGACSTVSPLALRMALGAPLGTAMGGVGPWAFMSSWTAAGGVESDGGCGRLAGAGQGPSHRFHDGNYTTEAPGPSSSSPAPAPPRASPSAEDDEEPTMFRPPAPGKSLLDVYPDLSKEWHSSRNGALKPADVTHRSNKMVWWKCVKGVGHEWRSRVSDRTNRPSLGYYGQCPFCVNRRVTHDSSLAAAHPELVAQWDWDRNEVRPDECSPGSSKRVWWKCPNGPDHSWQGVIKDRRRHAQSSCPYCANKRLSVTNTLRVLQPELATAWHPTKNGSSTPDDVIGGLFSRKMHWWLDPATGEAVHAPILSAGLRLFPELFRDKKRKARAAAKRRQ